MKRVWGIDPSMSHTAIVIADFNEKKQELSNWKVYQLDSKPVEVKSSTYQNVKDFARFKLIFKELDTFLEGLDKKPKDMYIETPTGSQNAAAMKGYAVSWMIIAYLHSRLACNVHLCRPQEVKEWATCSRTATKSEMIEAAGDLFPNFPWEFNRHGEILKKEEHKADALLTLAYGLKIE